MKQFFTQFLGIIALAAILSSCSSLENLSVKWKYRKDYWVKKSAEPKAPQASNESSELKGSKETQSIEKEITKDSKTSNVASTPEETAIEIPSKHLIIGSSSEVKTISKPSSILEKKMSKLHKKIKKANENGSTWGGLAFVFGLLGLIGLFFYGPLVFLSLLALIFGIIGVSGEKNGQGLAIVGIILAVLTLLILIGAIAFFSAAFF